MAFTVAENVIGGGGLMLLIPAAIGGVSGLVFVKAAGLIGDDMVRGVLRLYSPFFVAAGLSIYDGVDKPGTVGRLLAAAGTSMALNPGSTNFDTFVSSAIVGAAGPAAHIAEALVVGEVAFARGSARSGSQSSRHKK